VHSRVDQTVTVGNCKINPSHIFADDLILLTYSEQDLQHAVDVFVSASDEIRLKSGP